MKDLMTYEDFLTTYDLEHSRLYIFFSDSVGAIVHTAMEWYEFHISEEDSFDANVAYFEEVSVASDKEIINDLSDDMLDQIGYVRESCTGDVYKIV